MLSVSIHGVFGKNLLEYSTQDPLHPIAGLRRRRATDGDPRAAGESVLCARIIVDRLHEGGLPGATESDDGDDPHLLRLAVHLVQHRQELLHGLRDAHRDARRAARRRRRRCAGSSCELAAATATAGEDIQSRFHADDPLLRFPDARLEPLDLVGEARPALDLAELVRHPPHQGRRRRSGAGAAAVLPAGEAVQEAVDALLDVVREVEHLLGVEPRDGRAGVGRRRPARSAELVGQDGGDHAEVELEGLGFLREALVLAVLLLQRHEQPPHHGLQECARHRGLHGSRPIHPAAAAAASAAADLQPSTSQQSTIRMCIYARKRPLECKIRCTTSTATGMCFLKTNFR